jgi:hypothetical protein
MISSRFAGLNLASWGTFGCMMRRDTPSTVGAGPEGRRSAPKAASAASTSMAATVGPARSRLVAPVPKVAGAAQRRTLRTVKP